MATPWDAVYKELMVKLLRRIDIQVETEVEVGRLPHTIDVVVRCNESARQRLIQIMPFEFFREHNLLEFKSPRDPLTPEEYARIMGRMYFYICASDLFDLSQLVVCVVTSGKPVKVLQQMPKLVRFESVDTALYRSDDKIPFYVLVISELPVEERNYPLLLFSKGRKRKEFLQELLRQNAGEYIRFAYELYPQEIREVIIMSKEFPTLEENVRFIIQDLGMERLLSEMSPEEIARTVGPDRLLENLSSEEIARAISSDCLLEKLPPRELTYALRRMVAALGRETIEQMLRETDNDKKSK